MRAIAAVTLLLLLTPGMHNRAQAQSPQFAFERPVNAEGTGPRQLPVDEALLSGGRPFRVIRIGDRFVARDGLADLRLFDTAGGIVPHLLVSRPGADPLWVLGRVLAIPRTKTTSGFEVDFGRAQSIDTIRVEGIPAPYLKRLSVDGSGDRVRWTSLAPDATLFDLPAEQLRQIEVPFGPGPYRYVRVTWDDTNSARVPLPRIVRGRLAGESAPPQAAPIELPFERLPSEPERSRYRVHLPAARFPVVALELEAGGGHVFREAAVTESRFSGQEAAPIVLGRATLSRVVQDGVQASDLRIPIESPAEPELQLIVEDGSNPPLDVTRVLAHLAELPVIYFEAPASDVLARYGNQTLEAPRYDLEAVRQSIDLRRVPEARWGSPRALVESPTVLAGADLPLPGGTLDSAGFRHVRDVPSAAGGLVALQLDAAVLALSRGPAVRFADVRVLDDRNRQLPYLIERRDEPLELDLAIEPAEAKAAELHPSPGRTISVYRLRLPYANLPPATLVLETGSRVFQRRVRVGIERPPDRAHRDTWFEVLASADWRHADQGTAARGLSLRIPATRETELRLVVDEGDNAPLPIAGARLLLASFRLRYYQPAGSEVRLVYGRDDLQLPQYDLALLARQVMGAPAQEVEPGAAAPPPSPDDGGFISPLTFWILIGAAVLVLVGVIVRLIKP